MPTHTALRLSWRQCVTVDAGTQDTAFEVIHVMPYKGWERLAVSHQYGASGQLETITVRHEVRHALLLRTQAVATEAIAAFHVIISDKQIHKYSL